MYLKKKSPPGWDFTLGGFFWRYTYFSLRAENWKFPPYGEMDVWPFCMIFYMFSFYKNTDILITDKRSVISCKLEKKKIRCAYRFYISRCCKYCLLALYSCIEHKGKIGKLKETLKYIHYFLFPSLTSNLFVQELGILNVNLTSQISTKRSLQ